MKRKEKGWKKAVVLMLALIMCISSIVVPQPEEVSAKAANRIDFKINGKAGSKVTLYAGEYVKFTIDGMWQNGDYIQTSGTNAYGDKINFKPSKELTYKSSNNAVATVTNKGVITAKKKGTCKITVTSIYNCQSKRHDQSYRKQKETECKDHTGEKENNDRSRQDNNDQRSNPTKGSVERV